jgi:phage terminase large subunit-like protein
VSTKDEIRELALNDLGTFAALVNPKYLYGDIHKQVFRWLMDEEHPNQLLLLPRGHLKSHCLAVWAAWWVTKHPETTILYISATADLAETQLYAIKNMIGSPVYRRYWPEMIAPEEGKREKWATTAIAVDHPTRKEEGVRDYTIRTAGLTTNTTGWHADIIVPDDVVVPDNAYTADGRKKTAAAMSQMASILNTGGMTKACGTRYHPADQYNVWKGQVVPVYDENEEIIDEQPLWTIMEEVVETEGEFLWPRAARDDGKAFGFNKKELARISAMYSDRTQFHAQYYNDPNDPESNRLDYTRFQYYDKRHLTNQSGKWFYKEMVLNVYAAIDFAYTINAKSDFTAIVVIGIAADGHIYVLDIDRFKTDKISVYYDKISEMHIRWGFRKLRAEVTAAQSIIVGDLKDRIRVNGDSLSIDDHRPNRHQGSKVERMAAVLEPRYENLSVWHYKGGYIPALEEELVLARPQHDDIKDCLASVIEIAIKPKQRTGLKRENSNVVKFNGRFGGVSFR